MKNLTLLLILVSYSLNCTGQQNNKFNLDFESYTVKDEMPDNWKFWGDYTLGIDSVTVYTGRYSGITTSKDGGDSGFLVYDIPYNYEGKTITVEGYMKTENVKEGYAGFFLRLDANGGPLFADMMNNQNIRGTNDWKKYMISTEIPKGTEIIKIGSVLTGKGSAWYDDITIKIDGKNIQTLKEIPKKIFPAELDKEFDLGSNLQFPVLNKRTTSNLEILGKFWGFLKYYHPEIGSGNLNWDYELFRILPQYLNIKSKKERDQILLRIIERLGDVDECKDCPKTKSTSILKPDFGWITSLSPLLQSKLQFIYQNRFQGRHYYVDFTQTGNPLFNNENPYETNGYPDKGFRLLSLYRYWNIIHYFFPYKYLADKNWNTILTEYIPVFINAKNELDYELVVTQLIGEIGDSHGKIWSGNDKILENRGTFYAPFRVTFIENKLVVSDYYSTELSQGIALGDIITHIDNRPIQDIVQDLNKYYIASNQAKRNLSISMDLLRSKKSRITINYMSKGKGKEIALKLYDKKNLDIYDLEKPRNEKSYKLLNDSIGYISLQNIKENEIEIIKEKFKNTKGIIIDIRNYPSLYVIYSLAPYFVSTQRPFVKFTKYNPLNFGEFEWTQSYEIPASNSSTYKGKLVVLINEISHSNAEYTALALRAGDNTTIVGSTTSGADGDISSILLPGGIQTAISGVGVYYPNGNETQRVGIIPDIEIKPTIEGIKTGKDELLEKAIEVILEE